MNKPVITNQPTGRRTIATNVISQIGTTKKANRAMKRWRIGVQDVDGMTKLESINFVRITQLIKFDFKCVRQRNSYAVRDRYGTNIYYVTEASTSCMRQFAGPQRALNLTLMNGNGEKMLEFHRFGCCPQTINTCICLPFGLEKMMVKDKNNNLIGYIQQICTFWNIELRIFRKTSSEENEQVEDEEDEFNFENARYESLIEQIGDDFYEHVYSIRGGGCGCLCRCATDIEIYIYSPTYQQLVGLIAKHWKQFNPDIEFNQDHENFEIVFPMKSNKEDKALILGAAFLLNFMIFEMS
ncbi:hypothetical protein SNEBB_003903 [Seison nebaliae]|nr:hypothetical protein SNEBB_003903 [Seison nebaliae]